MIIDFHTHAFPDNLAQRALENISYAQHVHPSFDGTISGLLQSMDESEIDISVILNIATNPSQALNIIQWCKHIRSDRIIPFASIHPLNTDYKQLLKRIKGEGILGIKLHPMYQDFYMDSDSMFFMYEEIARQDVILLMHSGYDLGFVDDERADVLRAVKIHKTFPGLRLVLAHSGGWKMWDSVLEHIAGLNIWIDTSMTIQYCNDQDIIRNILKRHPQDKVLFGTDAPWSAQHDEVKRISTLLTDTEQKENILYKNARALLHHE